MAKLIEFYIPKDHHKDPRLDAAEPRVADERGRRPLDVAIVRISREGRGEEVIRDVKAARG